MEWRQADIPSNTMKKKRLYLVTSGFPYSLSDKPFIFPELNVLKDTYRITVITTAPDSDYQKKEWRTDLGQDIQVFRIPRDGIKFWDYIKCFLLFWRNPACHKEVKDIISSRRMVLKKIVSSMKYYAVAEYLFYHIKKKNMIAKEEPGIFYSFWYNERILGMALHREEYPNLKLMARAHGFDLYNERVGGTKRQPFKRIMDARLDKVVFVSQHGYEYYLRHFSEDFAKKDKYEVAYLGVKRQAYHREKRKKETLLLVSCAFAKPLKRIEYIIKALAMIDDYHIQWVHFGGGWKLEELQQLSGQMLGHKQNIVYELKGEVSNSEVLSYYEENDPECFITTSSTEGSPVSIQEALSFGMPVIGTAVGGIPEMIKNNGVLLKDNPEIEDVAAAIRTICSLTQEQYAAMCENSFAIWQEKFNQEENAKCFVESLERMQER